MYQMVGLYLNFFLLILLGFSFFNTSMDELNFKQAVFFSSNLSLIIGSIPVKTQSGM